MPAKANRLFLYGDVTDAFPAAAALFVQAAGGSQARIAVLLLGNLDRYLPRYRDPFLAAGATEVLPLAPDDERHLPGDAAEMLETATGIFMGGGVTPLYHQLYVASPLGAIIRRRCRASIPYGGVSAGALVAPELGIIAGTHAGAGADRHPVCPAGDRPESDLLLLPSLGLLPGGLVDAHFTERGAFPRLAAALEQAKLPWGLGIDEPACVEIVDETACTVHGRGRTYLVERVGEEELRVQVFAPGACFCL